MGGNAAAPPTAHADAWERAWQKFDPKADLIEPAVVLGVVVGALIWAGHGSEVFAYVIAGAAAIAVPFVRRGLSYAWARVTFHGRQALTEIGELRAVLAQVAPSPLPVPARRLPPAVEALADDRRTAKLLLARFPPAPSNPFMVKRASAPDDLLRDVQKWRDSVMEHLEPWPTYQGHFGGLVAYHRDPWNPDTKVLNDLRTRLGVLEQIYDQLAEEEGR